MAGMELIDDSALLHQPSSSVSSEDEHELRLSPSTLDLINNSLQWKRPQPTDPRVPARFIRSQDKNSYTLWLEDYSERCVAMLMGARRISKREFQLYSLSLVEKVETVLGTVSIKQEKLLVGEGVASLPNGREILRLRKDWGKTPHLRLSLDHSLGKDSKDEPAKLVELVNKKPVYDRLIGHGILQFNERVCELSIRNCQLVHPHDPDLIFLEMGKIAPNEFNLEWGYPVNGIQAMSFAILNMELK